MTFRPARWLVVVLAHGAVALPAHAGAIGFSAGDFAMSQQGKTPEPSKTPGKTQPDAAQDMVITPAGPVPRDRVHPVRPGETVRRNKDGSLEIVPKGAEPK